MSAMSSSCTRPQGPLAQLAAPASAIAAGLLFPSGKAATRPAKWPGLLTFTGLIGDWPCLAVTMKRVESYSPLILQCRDHAGQRLIGLLKAVSQNCGRRSGAIGVTAGLAVNVRIGVVGAAAIGVVLGELLSHAHCLEVHSEDCRNSGRRFSVMGQTFDFIENCFHLLLIILCRANYAAGGVESVDVGDFRSVQIVNAVARRAVHQIVSWVLVCPRCSAAFRFDH